jgi:hypothetical protein
VGLALYNAVSLLSMVGTLRSVAGGRRQGFVCLIVGEPPCGTLYADDLGDDIRQGVHVEKVVSKLQGIHAVMESITTLLGLSELQTTCSTGNAKRQSLAV